MHVPRSSTTCLSYEVSVIPRFSFPAIFLERIIRSDLPINLQALAFRAERNFEGTQILKMTVNSPSRNSVSGVSSIATGLQGPLLNDKKLLLKDTKDAVSCSAGASPLPPSVAEVNTNWGVFGKVCRLDKPCMVDEVHLRRLDGLLVSLFISGIYWLRGNLVLINSETYSCGLKENGGVHRCVIASITVKAPVREVWSVLTAYESLPEYVISLKALE